MAGDIIIYTDGSCRANPGPGGYAAVLRIPSERKIKLVLGADPMTTNNRMELMGAIGALSFLSKKKGKRNITLYTDSQYVQKGMLTWVHGWRRNSWITSTGSPVKNGDLWKELYELAYPHNIKWEWVRGHNGDKYNEMADDLADKAAFDAGYYKERACDKKKTKASGTKKWTRRKKTA